MYNATMPFNPELDHIICGLVGAWCERHEIQALRIILSVWPLPAGYATNEDWDRLGNVLRRTSELANERMTPRELDQLNRLIVMTD